MAYTVMASGNVCLSEDVLQLLQGVVKELSDVMQGYGIRIDASTNERTAHGIPSTMSGCGLGGWPPCLLLEPSVPGWQLLANTLCEMKAWLSADRRCSVVR